MTSLNTYYANSEPGFHLDVNEDGVIADSSIGLFGVIDAYGGSGIGDVVAELVKKTLVDSFGILSADEDATMPLYFNPNYSIETNALINSLKLSHSNVKELNQNKDTSSRGAASFLGCSLGDKRIQLVGTGNCLALLLRGDRVSLCFAPHSSGELVITGTGPLNNYPYSGIGLFDELEFFVKEVEVFQGDKLVLLSSGTYAPFNLTELAIILKEKAHDDRAIHDGISDFASKRGAKGNQSIVCLEF